MLQERLGRILATVLKPIHLPGGGTWRCLRCSTIAAGQVGKNIGNPLATGYSLTWRQNQKIFAMFNQGYRRGLEEY
jgi:hypothetical protein